LGEKVQQLTNKLMDAEAAKASAKVRMEEVSREKHES